ncbi:hypothetical protein Cni_G27856 [Canna indica]|uniref:Transmembrane protein n=1 Tax=Canna indica TaxID=4628 RepID=A0AAQ3L2G7_9LILI|nr:hypothetical protein Cni_G27856 [Canna indica]
MSDNPGKDVKQQQQPSPAASAQVLHQRRNLPYSRTKMAVGGFLFVVTIGYFTLYSKSKPGTKPSQVTRAAVNKPN